MSSSKDFKHFAICYFSLTGNTEYVCQKLAEALQKKDKVVELVDVAPYLRDQKEDELAKIIDDADCIGFGLCFVFSCDSKAENIELFWFFSFVGMGVDANSCICSMAWTNSNECC